MMRLKTTVRRACSSRDENGAIKENRGYIFFCHILCAFVRATRRGFSNDRFPQRIRSIDEWRHRRFLVRWFLAILLIARTCTFNSFIIRTVSGRDLLPRTLVPRSMCAADARIWWRTIAGCPMRFVFVNANQLSAAFSLSQAPRWLFVTWNAWICGWLWVYDFCVRTQWLISLLRV